MKLEFEAPEIFRSGNFNSKHYGFGDGRIIMNILRSKIYAQPIASICREVMSNSRDANREAGRAEEPITIKLPNKFDENISFIDYGLGISPDRMENIFIKYGNSSKRGDNIQTGGFGLGAKTPFAYTDTFTIVTTTDDTDGIRRRRTYISFIDETQLGVMSKVGVEDVSSDISTGTTITLGVKPNDIKSFEHNVRFYGSQWKVKPKITGYQGKWEWDSEDTVHYGDNWKLNNNGDPLVVIDGIPYKIRLDAIFPGYKKTYGWRRSQVTDPEEVIKIVLQNPIRLYFNVGDLTITANREDLDYQPETIQKIKDLCSKIVEALKKKVEESIKDSKNLWEASVIWRDIGHTFSRFIVKPQWNGNDLLNNDISQPGRYNYKLKGKSSDHITLSVFYYTKSDDKIELKRNNWGRGINRTIELSNSYMLIEDDNEHSRTNRLRLRTLFLKQNTPKYIAVVRFKTPQGRQYFEDEYQWSKLGSVLLSTIPKTKKPKSAVTTTRTPYKVHKVKTLVGRQGRSGIIYEWKPEPNRTAEDSQGGTYIIIKDGKATIPHLDPKRGICVFSRTDLAKLEEHLGEKIYGILYKWRKNINAAWKPLEKILKDNIDSLEARIDYKYFMDYGNTGSAELIMSEGSFNKFKNSLKNISNSTFKDWIVSSSIVEQGNQAYSKVATLRSHCDLSRPAMPAGKMEKILRNAKKDFPLAFSNFRSYTNLSIEVFNEILFYVEAKVKANNANGDGSDDDD